MSEPTVFVVDDDPEIRRALQWLFESVELNVRCYDSASAFLEDYNDSLRGCLLADVRMPGVSGLELLEQLKLHKNRLPVIVITGHGDVPMAVRAMKAGAIDFVTKPFNDQQLLEQIQNIIVQETRSIPASSNKDVTQLLASLTLRERQVLDLVVEGKLNKQIADELEIALSTVEIHRARVMKKMNARNLAQLIKNYLSVSA